MKRKTGNSLAARIMAAAIASVVVITGTPATVLADGEGEEVTIETVEKDISGDKSSNESDDKGAEGAVSTAIDSAEAASTGNDNESVTVKETVTEDDGTTKEVEKQVTVSAAEAAVGTALGNAQGSLAATKTNIENVNTYMGQLQSTDDKGNSIGLLPSAAADVNAAKGSVNIVQTVLQPVTDENGDPVYIIQLDENGNEIKDENGYPVYIQQTKLVALIPELGPDGNPIMIVEKDKNGNDVLDEDGNAKMVAQLKAVDYTDIAKNTSGSAGNAISSANTANTSGSESVARAAAQTAWDELEVAEEGLLVAGKAVYEASEKVKQAEKDLAAAEAAKKAAQEKYDQLKAELKNGQTNATAANEQLKAAERNMNALDQAAQKKYEDYIGGKENLEMLKNIDKCNQDLEDYIAKNIDKDENGDLVYSGARGYENNDEFWNRARKLSLALLEYSIKSGKLRAFNPEDNDNLVTFEDGYTLAVGDNFKVTLTTYKVPENPTAVDVKYDDNGQNPHIELKEENTEYEFDTKTGKWKNGKAVKGEEKAYAVDGMIKVKSTDKNNRIVVTFRDSKGNEIGSLPQFYFNYKVNPDGTVYYYQRTFTKDTETVEGDDETFFVHYEVDGFYLNKDATSEDNNINKVPENLQFVKNANTKFTVDFDNVISPSNGNGIPSGWSEVSSEVSYSQDMIKNNVIPDELRRIEYGEKISRGRGPLADRIINFASEINKDFPLDGSHEVYLKFDNDDNKILIMDNMDSLDELMKNNPWTNESTYGGRIDFDIKSITDCVKETTTTKIKSSHGEMTLVSSKTYGVKYYNKVQSGPVYAGYDSYTNETGITWLSDSVKSDDYNPDAQNRAKDKGQLTFDNGKYGNNFDYVAALNLKHVSDRYHKAAEDVKKASAATQKLKVDIDKLTVQYNGLKSGDEEKNPDNDLYKELQRLDREISKLRQNLNCANYELALKTKELKNLESKVREARDAVYGMDLSRFNGGTDDDNGDDTGNDTGDDSGSGSDTTTYTITDTGAVTVDGIPVIPVAASESGVAGVRTDRTVSRSGVAGVRVDVADEADPSEKSVTTKTVAASNPTAKKAADTTDPDGKDDNKVVKIANNEVPLVETPFEEGMQFNWLWLLAVAAALIVAVYIYDYHKRKAETEDELKKYDKK